jgi:transcription-repair coupling factor (superfamily II helicase)
MIEIGKDKITAKIIESLSQQKPDQGPVKVSGMWGSYAPLLVSHISKKLKRPVLYVTGHIDSADDIADDICVFSSKPVELFPIWEGTSDAADATDEVSAQRLRVGLGLCESKELDGVIITCSVQALNQPVPKPSALLDEGLDLSVNQTIEPELISNWLFDNGFERVDAVDIPGQYAVRGGIVDIFAPVSTDQGRRLGITGQSQASAIRVEFFGDCIESIRKIDLDSQRSTEQI